MWRAATNLLCYAPPGLTDSPFPITMKKFFRRILIALLLLVALLLLAGPKVIGLLTEDIYRDLIARQDEQSDRVALSLREYSQGWFSSQARLDVTLTDEALKRRIENLFGVGTRLQLNDQVAHGPIPFANGDFRPGLVSGKLALQILPGGIQAKTLANVNYRLRFDGGLNGTLQSTPVTVDTATGGALSVEPIYGDFSSNAGGSEITMQGHFGTVVDRGFAELTFGPGRFSLKHNLQETALTAESGTLRYTSATDGHLLLHEATLHWTSASSETGATTVDNELVLAADRLSGAFDATQFSARLRLERLDREAFHSARQRATRQLRDQRLNPVAILAGAILGELPNFLDPRPRLFIGPLRANVGGQQLAVDGQVGVIDGAIKTSPLYAWRSLDGQIAANLPRPVVDWLVEVLDIRAGAQGLVETGVLMPSASNQFLLDLSLQSGIVTLNGAQFEPDVERLLR